MYQSPDKRGRSDLSGHGVCDRGAVIKSDPVTPHLDDYFGDCLARAAVEQSL